MSELEYIRAAQNGDKKAMEHMIRKYEPLVTSLSRKYGWMAPAAHEDLLQEGRLGLYKAVMKFDATRGLKFMTVAFPTVRGAIQVLARKELRHPRFTTTYESAQNSPRWADHSCVPELESDTPIEKVRGIVKDVCGTLDSKRAQIICDKFGLFGKEALRNKELCEKYGLTKQAVHSYIVKFNNRARQMFPELEAYV